MRLKVNIRSWIRNLVFYIVEVVIVLRLGVRRSTVNVIMLVQDAQGYVDVVIV